MNLISSTFRAFVMALMLSATLAGHAQDLPGSRDHPLLKRFAGTSIVGFDRQQFDSYRLPTGTFLQYNFDTKRREFRAELAVEGEVTHLWYEAPGATTATELLRNYRNELTASGFETLYDSTRDTKAGKWTNFLAPFSAPGLRTNRSNYIFFAAPESSIRFATFKRSRPEGDVYTSVTTVEWAQADSTYKSVRGAYAAVDVIDVAPMQQAMVTVNAAEMSKAIAATGRVALYGLYFDSGSAEMKPQSQAALAEIASLLKSEPSLKLRVVGHTDNEGALADNLNLSRRRAESIQAALVKSHGIAPGRLSAHGVADLSPVASNASPGGKAKNRRVELVPG